MDKVGVPVLLYHGIVNNENGSGNPIHIPVERFARQMQWLHENQYQTITISEMLQLFQQKQIPQKKPIVLTFDDGYQSLLTNATPILEKFNFSATLFLTTGAVGKKTYSELNTRYFTFPENDGPLDWNQLKRMEQSCWDVQSHSRDHHIHNIVSKEIVEREMRSSKSDIENNLQKVVTFYSYPCGSYNTRCLDLLHATGYEAAFSLQAEIAKPNDDTRRLPRIEINRHTDLNSFKRKVKTGFAGNLSRLRASLTAVVYKNTQFKDAAKYLYDLGRNGRKNR
jgi:peptidoglycan/xylan/chitin deacetylase (PgdA/CDA1 family)